MALKSFLSDVIIFNEIVGLNRRWENVKNNTVLGRQENVQNFVES